MLNVVKQHEGPKPETAGAPKHVFPQEPEQGLESATVCQARANKQGNATHSTWLCQSRARALPSYVFVVIFFIIVNATLLTPPKP